MNTHKIADLICENKNHVENVTNVLNKMISGEESYKDSNRISTLFSHSCMPERENILAISVCGDGEEMTSILFEASLNEDRYLYSSNDVNGTIGVMIVFDGQSSVELLPEFIDRRKYYSVDANDNIRIYFSDVKGNFHAEFLKYQKREEAEKVLSSEKSMLIDGRAISLKYNLDKLGVIKVRKFQVMSDGNIQGMVLLKGKDGSFSKRLISIGGTPESKIWDTAKMWMSGENEIYFSKEKPEKEIIEELDIEFNGFSDEKLYGKFMSVTDYKTPYSTPVSMF